MVAEALTQMYRVYAMDARGHGDSDRCDVPTCAEWDHFAGDVAHIARAIAAEHGEERLAIGVGSSFGGIVTAVAQANEGNLFERIVMLDPPLHPTPEINAAIGLPPPEEGGDERRMGLVEMTLRRRTEWPSMQALRDSWAGKAMFENWRPEGFELYLEHGFTRLKDGSVRLKCDPKVEANIFGTTGIMDVRDFAPRVEVPLLMVRATQGHATADYLKAVVSLFPAGTYMEIDAGHLLPLEAPEACVLAIRHD